MQEGSLLHRRLGGKTSGGPRWLVPAGIFAVLLATAIQLIWLGTKDLAGALTYPGRLTGALLLATALAILAAALVVLDHWGRRRVPHSGLIALLGALAALIVNLLLLASSIREGDWTFWRFSWAALATFSGWAACAILRTTVVVPMPKRLAFAVVVTTTLAFSNFAYSRLYEPSARTPRLTLTAEFGDKSTTPDGTVSVPLKIRFANAGDTSVYILGATYAVGGVKVDPSARHRSFSELQDDVENGNPMTTELNVAEWQVIQMDTVLGFGMSWIDGGEEVNVTKSIQVAASERYDKLVAQVDFALARRDRMKVVSGSDPTYSWNPSNNRHAVDAPEWVASPGDEFVQYVAPIEESNAIAQAARRARSLALWWVISEHEAPRLQATIAPDVTSDDMPDFFELYDRYGLVMMSTEQTEKSLA